MNIRSLQALTNIQMMSKPQESGAPPTEPATTPPGSRTPKPPAPTPPPVEPRSSVGVFITPQSIATFPVASAAVTVIAAVLSAIIPALKDSKLVPLIVSFVVGLIIYYISLTDQMTTREKRIGLLIAVLNCFFLAASALGIDTVVNGPPTAAGS